MQWLKLLLAAAVLAQCAASETQTAPEKGFGQVRSAAGAKQRLVVLEWFCSGGQHAETMPCVNYGFLKKLRAAATPEEKRGLVTTRLAERRERQKDTAKVAAARESYVEMYTQFCDSKQADPAICVKWGKREAKSQ